MYFILVCLIFIILSIVIFRKIDISAPYSKAFAIAAALSTLAVVCLAQNYTASLISGINDGIAISNPVAYWIIGEDGWSQEMFKDAFESSIFVTLFFIFAYPITLAVESKRK